FSDVDWVAQDAQAPVTVAEEGSGAPVLALGARFAVSVQTRANFEGGAARVELIVDSLDDGCALEMDLAQSVDRFSAGVELVDLAVAVGNRPRHAPLA